MPSINHTSCPVCGSADIRQVMTVKDFTVSGESFPVMHCNGCQGRFTQRAPDAEGIGKYYRAESYISHTDTRKGLVNRMYHLVRNLTLAAKLRMVRELTGLRTGTLLDYGAGTGAFLDTMKRAGWTVTGLEPDDVARGVAKQRYDLELKGPEELSALPPGSFDVITLWHVLEHVHDLQVTVSRLERALKPGGILVIAVPNFTSGDAVHYGEFWAAWDVPRHLYHFSPSSMRTLLARHGLEVTTTRRMWFDSFYVSMLSEQYKRGKSRLVRAFFEGGLSNVQAITAAESCSSLVYIARVKKG
jgi:2-polyprenyl-3-methyl-5-hydroxy-6-metoxy-1,4-benzoquinol methylase